MVKWRIWRVIAHGLADVIRGKILPECRSILVLGARYPASGSALQEEDQADGLLTGRIASYAWGDDYHEILPSRLARIVAFIESKLGVQVPNRWFTDTGPLLERELGQRAGSRVDWQEHLPDPAGTWLLFPAG